MPYRVLGPFALFALLALAAAPAQAQGASNTSFALPSGERVLRQEADLNAPPGEVWRTLTTTEGLRSFLAPVVSMELKVGGHWEASYDPRGRLGDSTNIVNQVVAYLPGELLVTRIERTPPTFAHADVAQGLRTIFQLRALPDGHTHLAVSMIGWQSGPDSDAVYRFFERGNAYTLASLQRRFLNGPRQW